MAKKKTYVVVVGLKPAVYTSWMEAAPNVIGVPGAQHQSFTDYEEADKSFKRAERNGETRAVKMPPKDGEQPKDEGRRLQCQPSGDGPERPPEPSSDRRRLDSSLAGSVQAPNLPAPTPTPTSKGTSASKAARDARIAVGLTEGREGRIGPSASMSSVITTERSNSSRHTTPLVRSATEPTYRFQGQGQGQGQGPQAASTPRRPARLARSPKTMPRESQREPQLEQLPRTPETNSKRTSSAPASDIPTNKTQTRNRFESSSEGPATPRYAQSLSYASTSPSLSLRPSDMRSHLSPPSSFDTRYFPEDWPARVEQRRRSGDGAPRGDDQSSSLSVSEYATAPNTPEMGSAELATAPNAPKMKSIELEDVVEDVRDVTNANARWSAHCRVGVSEPSRSSANPSSSANAKARSKTQSSVVLPPVPPTQVISSPSATSTPRRTSATPNRVNGRVHPSIASVLSPSTLPEPKSKPATRVTRSFSEAEVQTDIPPSVCRRKNPEAAVQAAPPSPPKRPHVENEAQTSPVASPMRVSTGVGEIPVRPPLGGTPCRCEYPEYACIHCGQRPPPRTEQRSAHWSAVGVERWRASLIPSTPTPTTPASPAPSRSRSALSSLLPFATPASVARSAAPSSGSSRSGSGSARSTSNVRGHTPLMGPSESRAHVSSPAGRAQASLEMMSFAEAAQGAAVVHDVSFDPRSPIQRGTSVPAGTSGSVVRPSPAMAPVPVPRLMGSLGLLFPS